MSGLNGRIHVLAADAASLPFADGIFSYVVSTGDFQHRKDTVLALSEAHRVIKPGGHARFGGFLLALLWLHSFEQPFLDAGEMSVFGRMTDFSTVETTFTGAFCCLILKKEDVSGAEQGYNTAFSCTGTLKNASSSSKISMPNCIINSTLSLSDSIF